MDTFYTVTYITVYHGRKHHITLLNICYKYERLLHMNAIQY